MPSGRRSPKVPVCGLAEAFLEVGPRTPHYLSAFATCEVPRAQPHTLTVKPSELPLRVVLVLPDGTAGAREVAYVLRHTRAGGLLLNKDDLAPRADKAA